MNKFQTLFIENPLLESFRDELPNDYCWVLVEMNDSGNVERIVETDFGEPEDKTLARDFSWVADELNLLYSKNKELEEVIKTMMEKSK